ncbi:response regulator [candidate division KSB1 bacterium]|nr:response regulator [candidate division KSB1 bacterium]
MFRRVRDQILLLLALIALASVGIIVAYRNAQLRQMHSLLRDRTATERVRLREAVKFLGDGPVTMVGECSQWDGINEFVASRDTAWVARNLRRSLSANEEQAAWILDAQKELIYATNLLGEAELNAFPLTPQECARLLDGRPFADFFGLSALGLVKYCAAPIQPAADTARTSAPRGYLIIGRLWDRAVLSELNSLSSSETRLVPVGEACQDQVTTHRIPASIIIQDTLTGWDSQPLVVICSSSEFPVGASFMGFMRLMYWGTILLSLAMLGIVALFMLNSVSKPLAMISSALRDGDPTALTALLDRRTEFGTISRLIREFFAQRDSLIQAMVRQEQAELEGRRSVSLLEATLDSTADGILVVAADGRVSSYNRRFIDMWQIPPELISTRDDQALLNHVLVQLSCPEEFLSRVNELYNHPEESSFEVVAFLDGRVFERYSQPQRVGREIVGRVWSFRDVSRQRKSEAERDQFEQQLRRSQKLETIGTLAGGVAHDFNNILTPILGYADMTLLQLPPENPTRTHIESISRAALRAKDLVKQILTFSRQTEQEHRPMLVQLIVKEATKLLRASIPSTIEIVEDIDTNVPPVNCDPTQIHQVLMNLCTNAAHAMRANGGTLSIELIRFELDATTEAGAQTLPPGAYVRLIVEDTGEGMDQATLDRAFEPFFTTKKPGEGTGLGLSVVHGIVKSHGGVISASSELGQGTRFEIELPCTEAFVETDTPQPDGPMGGQGVILLVDDEPDNVDMAKEMLEFLGYEVVACCTAADALANFREDPAKFDVVITDQTMPHMTGAQLGSEILLLRPDTPIILMTGFSETVTQKNYRRYGFREIVMKPILARDLHNAVQRCITAAAIS